MPLASRILCLHGSHTEEYREPVSAHHTDHRCSSQRGLLGGWVSRSHHPLFIFSICSGSRLFTAVMPMVAAGLILDDPTLQPVRRLVSLVGTVCVWGFVLGVFCCAFQMAVVAAASLSLLATSIAWQSPARWQLKWVWSVIATAALDPHTCSPECHR